MTASPFNARRLEEQVLALVERSQAAMIVTNDADRRVVAANEAASELLRVPRDELIGRVADEFAPPERFDEYIRLHRAVQSEGILTGRFSVRAANGETHDIEYSAATNLLPGRTLSIMLPSDPGGANSTGAGPERAGTRLTPREREVLGLVARGMTTDQVARELVVSPETVRSHVANALDALGARTRAQAIALALQHGLLDV